MWWKKLLYFLLVIVLGIGITTLSGSIAFNSLSKDLLKKSVKNYEYTLVESFFNYASVKDEDKFLIDNEGDIHYEVYPCLVKQPYFIDTKTAGYGVKYDIVEEAIGFSFFHLPKDFVYKDNLVKAEVLLSLDNGEQFHLYLNNVDQEETAPNFHIYFPDYVKEYYSLNIYVTYNDFYPDGDDQVLTITKFELIDGNNQKYIEKEFINKPTFHSEIGYMFREACQQYREYILKYGEAHSVTTYERKDALLKKIDQIIKDNPNRFIPKPSKTIVLGETSFILTISITIAAYISIAIGVTRLLFKKKF